MRRHVKHGYRGFSFQPFDPIEKTHSYEEPDQNMIFQAAQNVGQSRWMKRNGKWAAPFAAAMFVSAAGCVGGDDTKPKVKTEKPVADIGLDGADVRVVTFKSEAKGFSVEKGVEYMINATRSHDPDGGNITNYEWKITEDNKEGQTKQFFANTTAPLYPYVFNSTAYTRVAVTVTDDENQTGKDVMYIRSEFDPPKPKIETNFTEPPSYDQVIRLVANVTDNETLVKDFKWNIYYPNADYSDLVKESLIGKEVDFKVKSVGKHTVRLGAIAIDGSLEWSNAANTSFEVKPLSEVDEPPRYGNLWLDQYTRSGTHVLADPGFMSPIPPGTLGHKALSPLSTQFQVAAQLSQSPHLPLDDSKMMLKVFEARWGPRQDGLPETFDLTWNATTKMYESDVFGKPSGPYLNWVVGKLCIEEDGKGRPNFQKNGVVYKDFYDRCFRVDRYKLETPI